MPMQEKLQYKVLIDSSTRLEKKVSLLKIEGRNEVVIEEIVGDIDLVVSVKALLDKHNLQLHDVSVFDSFLGPGSFTGLRLGITVTNILNWVTGKKDIYSLSYPEYGKEPNIQSSA